MNLHTSIIGYPFPVTLRNNIVEVTGRPAHVAQWLKQFCAVCQLSLWIKSHDEWPVSQTWLTPSPVYLGFTLDHILSYKQQLTKVANKLKSRNDLLMKLAGSSCGANANTLWSSALALCCSVAENCCPVWAHPADTDIVDVQLNSTMCLITGTLHSAPLAWLPVLANIEPLALRRNAAVDRLIEKSALHEDWPLHKYVFSPSCNCLPSCSPVWTDTYPIDVTSQWQDN